MKTPERFHLSHSGAFIVSFMHIVRMFLSLTLTICLPAGLSIITICEKVYMLSLFANPFLLLAKIHFIYGTNLVLLMFEILFGRLLTKDELVPIFWISIKLLLCKLRRTNKGKNRSVYLMKEFLHRILIYCEVSYLNNNLISKIFKRL